MALIFFNRPSGGMLLMLRISGLTTADRGIILTRLQVDLAPAKAVDCIEPGRKASMDLKDQLSPFLVLPYAGTYILVQAQWYSLGAKGKKYNNSH